jgi:ankyrin repeat protein
VVDRREAFEAVNAGDADRLRELLERDPGLATARGADGVSLIRSARYTMRAELVEIVLAADPELDVHDAAAVGDVDRLRQLADQSPALVRAHASDGYTPLHLAAFFGGAPAVRLLLDRSADPRAVAANDSRVAPVHSAAAAGDRESVRLVLDAGGDPNARQRGGFTPLHAAASSGDRELADLLLANGADPTTATDDGKLPRDLAAEGGHAELSDALAPPDGG